MSLSELEKQQFELKQKDLVPLYFKVKRYVITSEKVSNGGKLSVPAINELRNAFDHAMRAIAVFHGAAKPADGMSEFDYCITNVSKASGHIYRAGYDALDVISLALTNDIKRLIESVRRTTLVAVIPNYSTEIREPVENAISTCDAAKATKDIEIDGADPQNFAQYEHAIKILFDAKERLYKVLPELERVEGEARDADAISDQKRLRERNIAYGVAAASIVIGAIISWLF